MASLGSWREILQNAIQNHKHLKHSQHLQLATVRADGRPANRTLVFRGFVDGTDKLQFTTDSRSQKTEEMKHCPFGEICYYFTETWEQFRLNGILDLIGSTELDPSKKTLREKAWFDSSPRSRASFASPHPGYPKSSEFEQPQLDPSQGAIDTFCVLTLDPKEVDYYDAKKGHRIMFKLLDKQDAVITPTGIQILLYPPVIIWYPPSAGVESSSFWRSLGLLRRELCLHTVLLINFPPRLDVCGVSRRIRNPKVRGTAKEGTGAAEKQAARTLTKASVRNQGAWLSSRSKSRLRVGEAKRDVAGAKNGVVWRQREEISGEEERGRRNSSTAAKQACIGVSGSYAGSGQV